MAGVGLRGSGMSVRIGKIALLPVAAALLGVALLGAAPQSSKDGARPAYPWPHGTSGGTVSSRFPPPGGFRRLSAPEGSYAQWLRDLPLKEGTPPVHLYDGRLKANQSAHCALIDIDVGAKDLQQCADAVIRLRAEYLYSRGQEDAIAFHFTSGDLVKWSDWRAGTLPKVEGNRVTWVRTGRADGSYANFRAYLDQIFSYAGTASLALEVKPVSDPSRPQPGDLYLQHFKGDNPGHAVIVLDVARDAADRRVVLLGQSYMPAQEIQVLKNPLEPRNPWYEARRDGPLMTPEWPFEQGDLRRFGK
jgi:hypothetical protein